MIEKIQRVQKQARLSGGQEAAPPVEEFDPTSMGTDGNTGMWASEEVDPGEISKEWSSDKIQQAESVGPDGLDEQMWTSEEFTPDQGFDL